MKKNSLLHVSLVLLLSSSVSFSMRRFFSDTRNRVLDVIDKKATCFEDYTAEAKNRLVARGKGFLDRHEKLQNMLVNAENRKIPYKLGLGFLTGTLIQSFSRLSLLQYYLPYSFAGKAAAILLLSCFMGKPADFLYYRKSKYKKAMSGFVEAVENNDLTQCKKHMSYMHWYNKKRNRTSVNIIFLPRDVQDSSETSYGEAGRLEVPKKVRCFVPVSVCQDVDSELLQDYRDLFVQDAGYFFEQDLVSPEEKEAPNFCEKT